MYSPSKSSRPATIDESDGLGLGFTDHPIITITTTNTTTGYHREKPRININLDSPPLITSHPGSRHRQHQEQDTTTTTNNSSGTAAITMTDLSGGFSPSELWRRSATKDKDKEKNSFENHAFSPPTSSQQKGIRQPPSGTNLYPNLCFMRYTLSYFGLTNVCVVVFQLLLPLRRRMLCPE